MKTKNFLLILILILSIKTYSQQDGVQQYCFSVDAQAYSNCPPGTYFTACISYKINCPECAVANAKCCTVTTCCTLMDWDPNHNCCIDVPLDAEDVHWVISKHSYTPVGGEAKPGEPNDPTHIVGTTNIAVDYWKSVGTGTDWIKTDINHCGESDGSGWSFIDQFHLWLFH
jgi:hypothetical protein